MRRTAARGYHASPFEDGHKIAKVEDSDPVFTVLPMSDNRRQFVAVKNVFNSLPQKLIGLAGLLSLDLEMNAVDRVHAVGIVAAHCAHAVIVEKLGEFVHSLFALSNSVAAIPHCLALLSRRSAIARDVLSQAPRIDWPAIATRSLKHSRISQRLELSSDFLSSGEFAFVLFQQ